MWIWMLGCTDVDVEGGDTGLRARVGWTVTPVADVDRRRLTGNIGVAGHGDDRWIVWEDSWIDETDDRQYVARYDGRSLGPPELVQVASSSSRAAIAADAERLFVLSLMDCPVPGDCGTAERQVGLRVQDRRSGAWSLEPIDADQTRWDHGRSDLALADGEVHACFVVHYDGPVADEVLCTTRDRSGGWSEPVGVSGGRIGSDDHPYVHVGADGTEIVGYTSRDASGRRAALWLEESDTVLRLDRGPGHGEDVGIAEAPDGTRHLVWRESRGGPEDWEVMHGACEAGSGCDRVRDWTIEAIAGPGRIDAPDLGVAPDGTLVVAWTEEDRVEVAWGCADGLVYETPDGSPGAESTERGQPSLRVDPWDGSIDLAYRKESGAGHQVRWARRPAHVCEPMP